MNGRKRSLGFLSCSLFLLNPLFGAESGGGFVAKEIELAGATHRYQIFVPDSWSADRTWPLILFLHGAGERGTDGLRQTEVGLGPAIRSNPQAFPAVVVMPQCRRGVWWNDPEMEKMVLGILEEATREYRGDPRRIYLTGLSMGGYGTFYFGSKYPGRFAALVAVCGGVIPPRQLRDGSGTLEPDPYREVAGRIGATPVWMFHGAADQTVPASESRKLDRAFRAAGHPVRYTEYPGVGHNSWDRAYSEPGLFEWLFRQSLP